ncbi:MAG: penicillin-binding protein 2 [Elusimicrobia bacterium]|nr:penicillin-binding protein 2 [Elusimicrobiota bacterium]
MRPANHRPGPTASAPLNIKTRLAVCAGVCLLAPAVILSRLFFLQTIRHDELSAKASSEFIGTTQKLKVRGKISDRNGAVLAQSLPTYFCSAMKNEVKKTDALLAVLSKELELEPSALRKKWESAKKYVAVKTDLDPETFARLRQRLEKEKLADGVRLDSSYSRYYPNENMARDLLGDVDKESRGKSGLELVLNDSLSGELPRARVLKDRSGGVIENQEVQTPADEPADVTLTLDSRVQHIAESALDKAISDTRAAGGFALVQDPYTGDILASASRPSQPGQAQPFQWTYEPGSTFKLITISSALESRIISPEDKFDCENGQWNFFSKPINDDEKEGVLTVSEILVRSSNIGSAKIALKLGMDKFYSYVRSYGFGSRTTISFPGESKGLLKQQAGAKPLDLAINAFGYGVAVTGVQLAGAYSALANGGQLMEPRLVAKITAADGTLIDETKPAPVRRVITEQTAATVRGMLQRVVTEGTGLKAQIRGYSVAGKTGTAKKIEQNGKYSKDKFVASFCGFVPASRPKYTIVVAISEPKGVIYGGQVAAPAFAQIARNLLSMNAVSPDIAVEPQHDKTAPAPQQPAPKTPQAATAAPDAKKQKPQAAQTPARTAAKEHSSET